MVTSDEIRRVYEYVKAIEAQVRVEAEEGHGPGAWGAARALESATYYLFGAYGWLAKDEGLLDRD